MEKTLRSAALGALLVLSGCGGGDGNARPTITLLQPAADVAMAPGATVQITYVDDDAGDIALTTTYADRDGDLTTRPIRS